MNSLSKSLLAAFCLASISIQGTVRAAEAAWNISTLDHGAGANVSKSAWSGPLSVKQEGSNLIMESSGAGAGDCTQRIVPFPAGFD